MKTSLVPIVLPVLLLSAPATAADEAKFYPPEGWTVGKHDKGTMVQPPGVPAGKSCLVMIMPDAQGEVNVVFAMGWKTMTAELNVVSGGQVRAGRSMAGMETRSATAVV